MPTLLINDLRGGLNVTDPPLSIGDTQCTVAQNVEWTQSAVGRRRLGMTEVPTTALPAPPFWLGRFRPGASNSEAQLWTTSGGNWYRQGAALGSGSSFTVVTSLQTDVAGNASPTSVNIASASFNGKFFLAFDSDVDRLHVYDPDVNKVRRTGLQAPASAPAASNPVIGAGSYPAVARTYKTAWVVQSGGTVVRRSELSAVSNSFTPDGSHDSAYIQRNVDAPGEGETHWELYGSTDGANYYRLQTVDVGLIAAYDSTLTGDYTDYDLVEDAGTYSLLPSARYLAVDENRLVLAGSYETTAYQSRVWWTPVLGSDGVGDDERFLNTTDTKHYLDLDHLGEGEIRGIAGPLNDALYVFKEHSLYKLIRTGNVTSPYLPVQISPVVGCVRHQTIALGEDASGEAALYFLSRRGPYRVGRNGIEYLGYPIEARWTSNGLGNNPHTIAYLERHQVWFFLYEQCFVFDTRRTCWSEYTGMPARATASVMYGPIISTTQSTHLRPHVITTDSPATRTLIARDSAKYSDSAGVYGTEVATDVGESYQAQVTSKPYRLGGALANCGVTQVEVVAAAGGDAQVTLTRDFGLEERHLPVDLEPVGDEPYVIRHVEALELGSAATVAVTIGDAVAQDEAWAIESVALRYRVEEPR